MGFLALASAATFVCTPIAVWDGDGPIWCKEGPKIRIAGIAAREMDGTCSRRHPCPASSAAAARDALVGGIAESGRKRTLRPVLVERSGNGSGFNVSGARIAGDQRSFFFSDFSIIQRWNQCAVRKTKAMKITPGISIPSWPGLGDRKSVTATMADKIQEAKAGVIASAKTRGAVQFTDPSNAHCMGNRTSLRKRALARKDMRISRPIAMRAMIDWIISALPVDQNVSG